MGVQESPLVIESMFTGMNPTAFILTRGALAYEERAAAGRKPHARQFMTQNRVMPKVCHTDVADMLARALGPAQPGYERADLLTAGFPCQPYSTMSRKKLRPTLHPLFQFTMTTIEFIRKTMPRTAILENTCGFLRVSDFHGQDQTGMQFLDANLGDAYHISFVKANLNTWLDVSRPRVYILMVCRDVGRAADLHAIKDLMEKIECSRPPEYEARVEDYMFRNDSPEWRAKVLVNLQCRGGTAPSRAAHPHRQTIGETRALDLCAMLQQPDAHSPAQIMADSKLWGLRGTPRQHAVLAAVLTMRCRELGCSFSDRLGLSRAKHGLKWNISQNNDGLRNPADLSTQCRYSLPYSFQYNRLIVAEEMLRSHGWQVGEHTPDCSNLSDANIRDLVGEMQAVQSLAVVLWSLLLVVSSNFPGRSVAQAEEEQMRTARH